MTLESFGVQSATLISFFILIIILSIWEGVWKGIGMWKSARNNQLAWFICIMIFNTIGILPIIYILYFQKKQNTIKKPSKKISKKKTNKRSKK
jgi:hypothetical protein